MERKIEFLIKEKGICKTRCVIATVDVPNNWDNMPEDDKREYLIRPINTYATSYGQFVYSGSRFQRATGVENDVIDFKFRDV